MSTKLCMTRDINGYNAFGLSPTYDIYAASLTAAAEQHFVVPGIFQYWLAIFTYSPGANVWVNFSGTAVVPGGTIGLVASVLNPSGRQVKAGSTISFITSDATSPFICIELQGINNYSSIV